MFTNVLKKFFTAGLKYENKVATGTPTRNTAMMTDLKSALQRSRRTLVQDALGAASLIVILTVALHLPSLV